MWTRYAVVALLCGLAEGVIVAAAVRWSAARRGTTTYQPARRRSSIDGPPRVVPDAVGARTVGSEPDDGSRVALLDAPADGGSGAAPPEIRGGTRVITLDLFVGAFVLALLWFASCVVMLVVGDALMFGLIQLLWFAVVAGLPVAAAVLLVGVRRERRAPVSQVRNRRPTRVSVPAGGLLVGSLLLAPMAIYGSVIEPDRLDAEVVSGVKLAPGRAGSSPLRVGVIADIQTRHVGPHEIRAVEELMALHPDVILVAGDVFQDPAAFFDELPALRAMFGRLHAPGGVYLVQGDCDPRESLVPMIEGTDVKLLRDQIVRTKVRDRDVTIGGLDLDVRADTATRVIEGLQNTPGDGDIRILTSHRPDSVLRLAPSTRIDLVAAGHTHGGQISVPFVGPLLTLSSVPRDVGAGGLHDLDGRRIYVTKGVGLERDQAPQVRLNVVPSVGLVELV